MEVLTTSSSAQSIKIIARKDATSPTFELIDKDKRKTTTVTVTKTTDDDFMVLTGTFSLKEGRQYGFRVKDGSEEIYRGLILCTDQTDLDKFFINKDDFTSEDSYDNEFIFAE